MTIDYGFASTDDVKLDPVGLPIGEYHVRAAKEEQIDNFSETNPMPIRVTWKVLDGEHIGMERHTTFNVNNTNPVAANIARADIKKIAIATGRAVTSESPIQGRVLKVIVGYQKGSDQYTEIKKYMPADPAFLNAPVTAENPANGNDEIPF